MNSILKKNKWLRYSFMVKDVRLVVGDDRSVSHSKLPTVLINPLGVLNTAIGALCEMRARFTLVAIAEISQSRP
jgi:hypothetical protein